MIRVRRKVQLEPRFNRPEHRLFRKYPYRFEVRDLNKIWVWLGKECMHAYLTDGTNCWDISCPGKTTSEVEMHSDDLFMFCGESTKEERIKRLVSESDACLTGIKSAIQWIRKQQMIFFKNNDMRKTFLLNAFSLQMVECPCTVKFEEVSELPQGLTSAIGHPDTAAVLGVEMNRMNVHLHPGDVAYVAQLQGGRLAEGTRVLPEGFSFKFIKVEVS